MNSKLLLFLIITTLLSSCNNRQDKIYTKILNEELFESKSFLQIQITQQDSFIYFKVSDYSYLKPIYDSLKKLKLRIDNFSQKNRINQKDSLLIMKFKSMLEKNGKQSFEFKSLKIKSDIEDSLFIKIFNLDILKAKYKLNEEYISQKCNIVA